MTVCFPGMLTPPGVGIPCKLWSIILEKPRRAANQLKGRKVPGEGIYQMLKVGAADALLWLYTLLCSMWNTMIIPTDWRLVVPISKGKSDTKICNN